MSGHADGPCPRTLALAAAGVAAGLAAALIAVATLVKSMAAAALAAAAAALVEPLVARLEGRPGGVRRGLRRAAAPLAAGAATLAAWGALLAALGLPGVFERLVLEDLVRRHSAGLDPGHLQPLALYFHRLGRDFGLLLLPLLPLALAITRAPRGEARRRFGAALRLPAWEGPFALVDACDGRVLAALPPGPPALRPD